MLLLKVVGLVKTILILIAIMVIVRFVSRIMAAKKAADTSKKLDEMQRKGAKEKEQLRKNYGKTSVISGNVSAEDIDHEEVK